MGTLSRDEELVLLKAKLEARRDRSGFAQNVRDIEARIAELEAQA